jgi:dihydrofolate reductase
VHLEQLSIIVAVGKMGVIGCGGKLPWKIPDELKFFRSMTVHGTVIMGRKTYESIGKPLADRENWVLTRHGDSVDNSKGLLHVFSGKDEVIRRIRAAAPLRHFWVIGGREIYEKFLPHCSAIVCSEIFGDYAGDTYFHMPDAFEPVEKLCENVHFVSYRWRRRKE